ncbi:efflux RND transporter periplasmic adaptor subunit [Piscinibacter gummiphilus]|uniref:Efflux RND transporter periplasmic adaptor subunit n=1 Tax=Piscinibacter gummiphilus TaxID=946333 RepID=A0ABZ0CTP6_9BURK|nr:efflux RND transporter periplasmic adaptor subunit [Piscinibacter gummiphilus]WOB08358.1 efflux RND transporter periplasmic adaptor subunit [Piscinibacter gummiphilus]
MSRSPHANPEELHALLDQAPPRPWWRQPRAWLIAAALALVAGGVVWWQSNRDANAGPSYATQPITRGNLRLQVTANGTLQPTRSVNIGSELSGTVARVLVDVNDRVKKGQVLVELDTAKLSDQILRSRATLASARARVAQASATLKEAQGNLARLEEVARLSGGKVPSKAELDTGRASVERAQADEASARATVADAQAALSTDETNLKKASIRSPTDGVVLTRNVDPGNAVAASLQAVTLFTIAEDLTRLRLQVNVDEADVGAVQVGQKANFTVSAYPGRRYPATITRVAYGSTITENVVTYVTYLDVDNADLSLRPGMTATATITATERQNVLLVPNTALRFTPSQPGQKAQGTGGGSGIVGSLMPRMPRGSGQRRGGNADAPGPAGGSKQLWVLQDGKPVPLRVTTGITDGRMTEVSGEGVQEGLPVITEQRATAK